MEEKKYELVKFNDEGIFIDVRVSPEENTVWLTQREMANLFNVSIDSLSLHINNIIREGELDSSIIEESSTVQFEGERKVKRLIKYYNLDMVISVGYRVKSKRGIIFRKWASSVLKEYLLKGYVINENRVTVSNEIQIQNKKKFQLLHFLQILQMILL